MTKSSWVLHSEYSLPADFLKNLPLLFNTQGTIIYNHRNQIRVFDVVGQKINVKKFAIPSIFNRFLYSIGVRTPKAKSAYKNALKIKQRGFNTPQPLGYLLERNGLLIGHSYLITEQEANKQIISRDHATEDLLHAVARYTAELHEKGLLHCDYTPNNILFSENNGKYEFSLVDVNQFIFRREAIPVAVALPYLINLFVEEKALTLFIAEYAAARNADVQRCCQLALKLRHSRTFYSHLKKLLKKLPFARYFQTKRLDKQSDR